MTGNGQNPLAQMAVDDAMRRDLWILRPMADILAMQTKVIFELSNDPKARLDLNKALDVASMLIQCEPIVYAMARILAAYKMAPAPCGGFGGFRQEAGACLIGYEALKAHVAGVEK